MLLGCCHCGSESLPPSDSQPPSESTPPSDSGSASGYNPPTITGNCAPAANVCAGDIAPAVFGISVPTPTPAAGYVCHPHYEGSFSLLYIANSCFTYETAERGKELVGFSTCNDIAAIPRWRLTIGIGGATTVFGLQPIYRSFGFNVSGANYSLTVTPGNTDCVKAFTLTRTALTAGWSLPTTLVITPL